MNFTICFHEFFFVLLHIFLKHKVFIFHTSVRFLVIFTTKLQNRNQPRVKFFKVHQLYCSAAERQYFSGLFSSNFYSILFWGNDPNYMKTDRKITQTTRFLLFIVYFLHLFFNKSHPSSKFLKKPENYKGFSRFFDFKIKLNIKLEN